MFLPRSGRGLPLLFVSLAVAHTVFAQTDLEQLGIDEAEVDEIITTGTRIKRLDHTTTTPTSTIDRTMIDNHGQPTLDELLAQMPYAEAFSNRTANHVDGTAAVDLRGFGPGRVLVLQNGRRLAPSGTGNAVDINNIPQYLVERVETITGGASAVYGSDAVAGVMNFITRSDLDGLQIDATYGVTDHGDADVADLNVSYGHNFASGRGNVTVYAGYMDRSPLGAMDRDFTSAPRYEDIETGELRHAGHILSPSGTIFWPQADLGTGPTWVTFDADGTPRPLLLPEDLVNILRDNYIQLPLERITTGLLGEYQVNDRFEGYVEASFANNQATRRVTPAGFGGWINVNLDNPVLTDEARQLFIDNYACDTNLACFDLGRAMAEVGPRYHEHDRNYLRVVAGLRGMLTESWDIDAWLTWTRESSTEYFINGVDFGRAYQGLLVDPLTGECYDPSNGCVPLDVFGPGRLSEAGAEFIRLSPQDMSLDRTHKLASVFVTGAPIETGAGPLDMAFGAEWRSDAVSYRFDDALHYGDPFGLESQSAVAGTDSVFELYGEAVIPLLSGRTLAERLSVELGARYSDYRFSGGLWTNKAGADWQVNETLRIRAMRQKSVRAPNTEELFTEQIPQRFYGDNDRCSASRDPVGNGLVDNCIASGLPADQIGVFEADPFYPVDVIFGGNPNLLAETAETWTAGVVLTPPSIPRLIVSSDYYQLELSRMIGSPHIVNTCFDPENSQAFGCSRITRDETFNIAEVLAINENFGFNETRGVDTQVQYVFGDFGVHLLWTHQLNTGTGYGCVGYHGTPCYHTSPRNRANTNFSYAIENGGMYLGWRYIQGTKNGIPKISEEWWGIPDPVLAIPEVGDVHYFDAGFRFDINDKLSLRLNIENLLDEDPPMMFGNWLGINTDTALYDVFGRSYYLGLSLYLGD